jgi:hypothetical protein
MMTRPLLLIAVCLSLSACASGIQIGVNVPIGKAGAGQVTIGSDGRVGGSVGVGGKAGSVSVGGTLPRSDAPQPAASAAPVPTNAAPSASAPASEPAKP